MEHLQKENNKNKKTTTKNKQTEEQKEMFILNKKVFLNGVDQVIIKNDPQLRSNAHGQDTDILKKQIDKIKSVIQ